MSASGNVHSVSEEVYSTQISILDGTHFSTSTRNAHHKAAYRIFSRRIASVEMVTNPLTRKKERRVIVNSISGHKVILLKKSEVRSCINFYITKCKGLGARKVYYSMSKKFCGISEREIQHHINRNAKHQRLHPAFTNKAPLNPVESSGVFNHVQIDLVSMERFPCVVNDNTYKYILVILDVFSRYIFLRPLTSKRAEEVASKLVELFSDTGPPKRLQCDQRNEFRGVVNKVTKALKVQVIRSRPYHPQSQGKVREYI